MSLQRITDGVRPTTLDQVPGRGFIFVEFDQPSAQARPSLSKVDDVTRWGFLLVAAESLHAEAHADDESHSNSIDGLWGDEVADGAQHARADVRHVVPCGHALFGSQGLLAGRFPSW